VIGQIEMRQQAGGECGVYLESVVVAAKASKAHKISGQTDAASFVYVSITTASTTKHLSEAVTVPDLDHW
jgi:hypothetical protein